MNRDQGKRIAGAAALGLVVGIAAVACADTSRSNTSGTTSSMSSGTSGNASSGSTDVERQQLVHAERIDGEQQRFGQHGRRHVVGVEHVVERGRHEQRRGHVEQCVERR